MAELRVSDLTVEQLVALMRQVVREEIASTTQSQQNLSSLDDFPVDNLGPWPEGLTLRREEIYGDDER